MFQANREYSSSVEWTILSWIKAMFFSLRERSFSKSNLRLDKFHKRPELGETFTVCAEAICISP